MIFELVCLGVMQNLKTAALFEPAKSGLALKPCMSMHPYLMDGIIHVNTFGAIVLILISYIFLILSITLPKRTLKECEDMEKYCGRCLYAALVASFWVSEKNMYVQFT